MKSGQLIGSIWGALLFLTLLLNTLDSGHGARILAVSFWATKSHMIVYEPFLKELARRGHDVTILSPIPSQSKETNPRHILTLDVPKMGEKNKNLAFENKQKEKSLNPFFMVPVFGHLCSLTYSLPQVQALLGENFDLVFYVPFMNECAAGFVHKFNTTTILIATFSVPGEMAALLGSPAPPSYVPNLFSTFDQNMNFRERTLNFLTEVGVTLLQKYYFTPVMEGIYREALSDPSIPSRDDIIRNASLTLTFTQPALNGLRPYMPDIVEVGGLHLRKAKPLPKDLEDFVNSSGTDGFIFFSMGSTIQGSAMPESHRKLFLEAFSKLKQKVLWKWETETMEGLPKNVKLIKWAPQQDILGHSKIRAFMNHAGMGGIVEAIFNGVPLIGIPIYGDQYMNMEGVLKLGVARQMDFNTLTAQVVIDEVKTVLNDPKYAKNAKKLADIYSDQPIRAMEKAIFWTEYVLRHNGAVHLRPPSRNLNFFQINSLDVLGALLAGFLIFMYVARILLKKIWQLIKGKFFGGSAEAMKLKKT